MPARRKTTRELKRREDPRRPHGTGICRLIGGPLTVFGEMKLPLQPSRSVKMVVVIGTAGELVAAGLEAEVGRAQ